MSCSRIIVIRCMCSHLCQKLASMERIGFQYEANWDWDESLDPLCCNERTWGGGDDQLKEGEVTPAWLFFSPLPTCHVSVQIKNRL